MNRKIRTVGMLWILVMCASCAAPAATAATAATAPVVSDSVTEIVAQYRQEIPLRMQQEHIPGLAIAVVDEQGVLWAEGFGYTDWDRQIPVTPSTLFSIQSMSKSFTATAVMLAAQDGLVDLDAPVTDYLPGFTVHSIFEEQPEQKMTLRILLSHTAGFPHDPTYGGNLDGLYGTPAYSFEKHIASVSDTWLMFPVGSHYSYSNIGIDLAGYIVQVRAGMSFLQYVQKKVFDPLGMKDSTLDYQLVRSTPTRAIGHFPVPIRPPVDFQLLPSGGVWSTAEDMARYLQFQINKGALDGNRLLREDLAETMYLPPNPPAQIAYPDAGYALGISVNNRNNTRHFQHGGGGFGFQSSMVWYPDLQLGAVVLTNFPQSDGYCVQLSEDVLERIMMSDIPLYHQRAISAVRAAPALPFSRDVPVLSDAELAALIASKALFADAAHEDEPARLRKAAAVGTYLLTAWGLPADSIQIGEQDGSLFWTYHGDMMIDETSTLTEVKPGLFFSTSGNLVDLRAGAKLIDNIHLTKTNPRVLPFWAGFCALCGLVFLSPLFVLPGWAILRRQRAGTQPARRWLAWVDLLTGMTALFSLFCLVIVALVPSLAYLPWPRPYADLAWWQSLLFSVPFASLVLAAVVVALAVLALGRRAETRTTRWYTLAVGLTMLAFHAALLT